MIEKLEPSGARHLGKLAAKLIQNDGEALQFPVPRDLTGRTFFDNRVRQHPLRYDLLSIGHPVVPVSPDAQPTHVEDATLGQTPGGIG